MQEINSTDLHILFNKETGEYFQYSRFDGYHSTEGYSREYAKWLEERYLDSANHEIRRYNLLTEQPKNK